MLGVRGTAVGVVGAVEAGDGKVGGGVCFVCEVFGVLLAEDAVFWAEEGGEVYTIFTQVRVVQIVDGPMAIAIEASLVGEQAETDFGAGCLPDVPPVLFGDVEKSLLLGGFEDVNSR